MADTYSKLLGLSADPPLPPSGKPKPEQEPDTKREKTSLLANQQTRKEAGKQMPKEIKKQTGKEAHLRSSPTPASSPHNHLDTSLLTTKEKTKYGTYLTDEAIEKIRIRAIQTKRDDHQILQEAVNLYFDRLEK